MFLKRLLMSCLIWCLSFSLMANKDSLWAISQNEAINDTIKLDAGLQMVIDYYLYQNTDSALIWIDHYIKLAISIQNKKREARFWNLKGALYEIIGQYEMAIIYFKKALEVNKNLGNQNRVGDNMLNISGMYEGLEKYDSMHYYDEKIYQIGIRFNQQDLISNALFSYGNYHFYNNNYAKALKYYLECANTIENYDFDKSYVSSPYINIAEIYGQLGNVSQADSFYIKDIEFNKKYTNNIYSLGFGYASLGAFYNETDRKEEAKLQIKKALNLIQNYPDYKEITIVPLIHYSQILLDERNNLAINYIDSLIVLTKDLGHLGFLSIGQVFKGIYFLQQNKLDIAHYWCMKGFESARKESNTDGYDDACDCLYQVNKKKGNTSEALKYFELKTNFKDSTLNEGKIQELIRLEMQYTFDKQQLQDSLTNQQQLLLIEKDKAVLTAQNRNYLIVSLGIGLLALTILGFYLNVRSKNQLITQQKSDLEQLNTTKDRLFAIISHDLRKPALAFRGISKKVKFLIQQQEFETLDKYGASLEKAAYSLNGLLDNLLNWALQQRDVLPYNPAPINVAEVSQEIYDLFHQMAADKNIHLKMNIPESTIIFADLNAYATIVRNLMDNAIKYTPEGGTIDLSAEKVAGKVAIKVADTGTGIASGKIAQLFDLQQNKSSQGTAGEMGSGLGLTLVKDLVALNKGTIRVVSEVAKGTIFEVMLPAA